MIKGIIFDYGGTLDSQGEHWSHVLRRGWQASGLCVPDEEFRRVYVIGERTLAQHRIILPQDDFHAVLLKKTRISLEALDPAFLAAFAESEGLGRQEAVERLAQSIANHCDQAARRCIEASRPVLEQLSARYPLCLVSNFYGNIDSVIRSYGIRQYFSHIIESAVVGVRKPNARIFMLGVVALGFEPSEVLVVGDSLIKDILPAESIGCHAVWLKGPAWDDSDKQSTHPFISALSEIKMP